MNLPKLTLADLDAALTATYFKNGAYWGYVDEQGTHHL
jgi:hypothetical protein